MIKNQTTAHKLAKFLLGIKDKKHLKDSVKNTIYLALFLIEHISTSQTTITFRELYYILFQRHALSYSKVYSALNNLCKLTFTPREQYQVVSDKNLFIYGDLVCSLSSENPFEQTTYVNFLCSTPAYIPSSMVIHFGKLKIELNSNVRYLVIIEKHAVLNRISQFLNNSNHPASIKAKQEIIFITGKGFASLLCRKFICLFLNKYKNIKPFILSDADPHGFMIYLNYKLGNNKQSKRETYLINKLEWLGLSCLDDYAFDTDSIKTTLKLFEIKICLNILKRKELRNEEKIHLLFLLKMRKKIEIESLFDKSTNGEKLLLEYITHKIRLFEYSK